MKQNPVPAPAAFGPFCRVESPTQTANIAAEQEASGGELWGSIPRLGAVPQVKAYRGLLRDGERGIEFWTDVPPDPSYHRKSCDLDGPGGEP